MKKYSTDASEAKSVSVINKIEAEIEKVAQSIYEKTVAELKENYEKIKNDIKREFLCADCCALQSYFHKISLSLRN